MKYYTIPFFSEAHEISKARYVSAMYREETTDMCFWYNDGEYAFIGDAALDVKDAVIEIIKVTGRFDLNAVQIGISDDEYKIFKAAADFTKGGLITVIKDKYNDLKTWLIKRTTCRHFYLNQAIGGKLVNPKWTKSSKAYINSVLDGCLV